MSEFETAASGAFKGSQTGAQELCLNCDEALQGDYCHTCGQKRAAKSEMYVAHFFKHFLQELLSLDSKLIRTFKTLLRYPGKLSAEFLDGKRLRYIRPVRLYLILSTIYFLFGSTGVLNLENLFEFAGKINPEQGASADSLMERIATKTGLSTEHAIAKMNDAFQRNVKLFNISIVLFLALFFKFLFRKQQLVYVEHLVVSLHLHSFSLIISLITGPLILMTPHPVPIILMSIAPFCIYFYWALKRVYQLERGPALRRSLLTVFVYLQLQGLARFVAMVFVVLEIVFI